MNFGTNILELRKQKNVTQEELAAQLGITAAAVSKWENNYTLPDIMMLCALADYFEVTTDELLGRTTDPKMAVIVAKSAGLAGKIGLLIKKYGFTVVAQFTTYREALSYALSSETCRYIFTGGSRDLISSDEIEDTPSQINSIHIIGDADDDILHGLKEVCDRLHLITK